MRFLALLAVSLMTLFSFMPLQANAGEDSIQAQIEELKKKIEMLEQQSQQMNMKMYEATDTKAWHNKIKVKTKKGTGLTFQTADKNYKMRMRLRGQFLANYINSDGGDNKGLGFRIRRLRVVWDGNAFAPWMKYKVEYDLSRNGELKDIKLSFAKNKALVPVVGQYKVPFNKERLNSSSALQLVGRSIITDYFEYGRDIGGGVYGLLGDGMIRYDFGLFQGQGANVKNDKDNTGVLWAGRVQAAILGGKAKKIKENFARKPTLIVGVAVAGIDVEEGSKDSNIGIHEGERDLSAGGKATSFTADVNYRDPRFNLIGEYIGRWVNPDETGIETDYDYGFRVQGGFFLIPKKIELASRYARVTLDDGAGNDLDNVWTFTQGLNYYLSGNHKWKVQLDYTFQREEDLAGVESDESMVRAQVQAYF
ncbi:MAG: hypothetical protein F4Y78_00555 [Candidatus Dadabacteria bacterium]|nr:hypothetical protein [Candidatus Dadabacteria bacterium]MYA48559.1 hypothetical protein [Candidatus Dadabacteria bacterium]MYF48418.1 hypothetical protein [Candidatus Dadabacteria bacterium]MYG83394.1 hypothetical protein [Candidatus Dadabacteria bacterium]MYK49367.1 hypothetical protein [Candidatus Dadabacteria bacterium]